MMMAAGAPKMPEERLRKINETLNSLFRLARGTVVLYVILVAVAAMITTPNATTAAVPSAVESKAPSFYLQPGITINNLKCDTCHFAGSQVKKLLQTNKGVITNTVTDFSIKACGTLPAGRLGGVQGLCQKYVESKLPEMVANFMRKAEPASACDRLPVCAGRAFTKQSANSDCKLCNVIWFLTGGWTDSLVELLRDALGDAISSVVVGALLPAIYLILFISWILLGPFILVCYLVTKSSNGYYATIDAPSDASGVTSVLLTVLGVGLWIATSPFHLVPAVVLVIICFPCIAFCWGVKLLQYYLDRVAGVDASYQELLHVQPPAYDPEGGGVTKN